MIMAVLAATALLAAAPASAQSDMQQIAEVLAKRADTEGLKLVKERRFVPRQVEGDTDKLAFGSSAWWQQVDRDRPGRRR
jgi:hypothetical protein